MAKSNVPIGENWARAPPPSGPVWRNLAHACYNPDEGTFLGRTAKRWGIVLTFYMVFYAVLALMFAACMAGLFLIIDPKMPVYTLQDSLIGANPGVAYRPRDEDTFLLSMDTSNATVQQLLADQVNGFLAPYKQKYASDLCSNKTAYGYPYTPCFYIKLNKIFHWKPECYNDLGNLPSDMPNELLDYIKSQAPNKRNQIWMNCWEENSNQTKIEYPLGMGLPADYYPFTNEDNYLSPLLVIKLTPPVNKDVFIRCRMWAKNIIYNKSMKEPSGYTRIQFHIKDKTSVENPEN